MHPFQGFFISLKEQKALADLFIEQRKKFFKVKAPAYCDSVTFRTKYWMICQHLSGGFLRDYPYLQHTTSLFRHRPYREGGVVPILAFSNEYITYNRIETMLDVLCCNRFSRPVMGLEPGSMPESFYYNMKEAVIRAVHPISPIDLPRL